MKPGRIALFWASTLAAGVSASAAAILGDWLNMSFFILIIIGWIAIWYIWAEQDRNKAYIRRLEADNRVMAKMTQRAMDRADWAMRGLEIGIDWAGDERFPGPGYKSWADEVQRLVVNQATETGPSEASHRGQTPP